MSVLHNDRLRIGESLGKDDVQYADPAAYMAVHGLLAFSDTSRDDFLARLTAAIDTETRLLQAVACLEAVVERAPSAPYARFLLVRIYRYLGMPAS